jgi:hypothetical protein
MIQVHSRRRIQSVLLGGPAAANHVVAVVVIVDRVMRNEVGSVPLLLVISAAGWGGSIASAGIGNYVRSAFVRLVAPLGLTLDQVRVVVRAADGGFDFYGRCAAEYATPGPRELVGVPALAVGTGARSRAALMQWTGASGRDALAEAEQILGADRSQASPEPLSRSSR